MTRLLRHCQAKRSSKRIGRDRTVWRVMKKHARRDRWSELHPYYLRHICAPNMLRPGTNLVEIAAGWDCCWRGGKADRRTVEKRRK